MKKVIIIGIVLAAFAIGALTMQPVSAGNEKRIPITVQEATYNGHEYLVFYREGGVNVALVGLGTLHSASCKDSRCTVPR